MTHRVSRTLTGALALAAILALSPSAALAGPAFLGLHDGSAPERVQLTRAGAVTGTLAAPLAVQRTVGPGQVAVPGRPAPFWTPRGLWWRAPRPIPRPVSESAVSPAVYDPSSAAWFATTAGVLVRVEPDGDLVSLVDGVQGSDFDIRAAARVVVSREAGRDIVLHRYGGGTVTHTALLSGEAFFGPRLSPTGDRVLLSESRPDGGHIWLVTLRDGRARDLGPGVAPTWHPDGHHILFARTSHDGHVLTGGELWLRNLTRHTTRPLTATPERAEVAPAVSPDGRFVAFADGRTGALFVATLPVLTGKEGGR